MNLVVNEPEEPTRDSTKLIQEYLHLKDLPWVDNMSAAWILVNRMAELQEDEVIGHFQGPSYVSKDTPTSQMVLDDDEIEDHPLADEIENGKVWIFFLGLPMEREEDDPVTCDPPNYDFVHEKPEMVVYAAALKVAELLRDGVIPRKWIQDQKKAIPISAPNEASEYTANWVDRDDTKFHGP